jgi:hypothetical protein
MKTRRKPAAMFLLFPAYWVSANCREPRFYADHGKPAGEITEIEKPVTWEPAFYVGGFLRGLLL